VNESALSSEFQWLSMIDLPPIETSVPDCLEQHFGVLALRGKQPYKNGFSSSALNLQFHLLGTYRLSLYASTFRSAAAERPSRPSLHNQHSRSTPGARRVPLFCPAFARTTYRICVHVVGPRFVPNFIVDTKVSEGGCHFRPPYRGTDFNVWTGPLLDCTAHDVQIPSHVLLRPSG
jgi:hypothetical protein